MCLVSLQKCLLKFEMESVFPPVLNLQRNPSHFHEASYMIGKATRTHMATICVVLASRSLLRHGLKVTGWEFFCLCTYKLLAYAKINYEQCSNILN